jgi:hypothetical protein
MKAFTVTRSRGFQTCLVLFAAVLALPLAAQAASVASGGTVLAADTLDQRVDESLGGSPTLRVQDHRLVNGAGQDLQLRGVNRAVFESRCTYDNTGIADGPIDQTSVSAMLAWKINAVRVTLNEDCWLGINELPLDGNAASYRAEVADYVGLLRRNGLYVLLVPESSAPGSQRSTQIDYMPDSDYMLAFWSSVAATFKDDHGIVFDPITEVAIASVNNPHPTRPASGTAGCSGALLTPCTAAASSRPVCTRSWTRSAPKRRRSRSWSAGSATTPTSASC